MIGPVTLNTKKWTNTVLPGIMALTTEYRCKQGFIGEF